MRAQVKRGGGSMGNDTAAGVVRSRDIAFTDCAQCCKHTYVQETAGGGHRA